MNWDPSIGKCRAAESAQTGKARQSQSWSESEIAKIKDGVRKLLHKDLFSTLIK